MTDTKLVHEVDIRALRFIVGLIPIAMAIVIFLVAENKELESISASYWDTGPWARNIFVGLLFAESMFLFSYLGKKAEKKEFISEALLSRFCGLAAIGVAIFPCSCNIACDTYAELHYFSAACMFGALFIFCIKFHNRCRNKAKDAKYAGDFERYSSASKRKNIYLTCGALIFLSMFGMLVNYLTEESISNVCRNFVFYAETVALIAFGFGWLVASRVFPYITIPDERYKLKTFSYLYALYENN